MKEKKNVELENTEDNINKEIIDNLINNMIFVEGGQFTMGDYIAQEKELEAADENENEDEVEVDECVVDEDEDEEDLIEDYIFEDGQEAHKVTLSSFYISKYPVTQKEWKAVMGYEPINYKGDNYPVNFISWNSCQEFIKKLNELTNETFSLPTEAQWEFAAKDGKKNCFSYLFGYSEIPDFIASYDCSCLQKVGLMESNYLGIFDMIGCIDEWCNDWYDVQYYKESPLNNPTGPKTGCNKVFRGGNWKHDSCECCVFRRKKAIPELEEDTLGFRLCLNELKNKSSQILD